MERDDRGDPVEGGVRKRDPLRAALLKSNRRSELSALGDFPPVRLDIPSGDAAAEASFASLPPEGGSSGAAAGTFRDDPVPFDEQPDGGRDFFQGNLERSLEEGAHQIPHLGEHTRRPDSIDETRD